MKKFDHFVNVIDLESSCWEAPEIKPCDQFSEIIEIGIAVVDTKKFEVVENDSIIIRPQNSKISKFCTKLTTLTQEIVDQGVTYQAAMEIIKKYKTYNRTFISWGDYDRKMFETNCKDYKVGYPFGPRHLNLKNCFTILHGLDSEPSVSRALDHLGLKFEGTPHRGDSDAFNIAKILIHTLKTFRNE